MNARKPPSGRDIWQAVRQELAANLYTLPFSRLAPSVYHVYLHPDDFETIEGVVPRLVEDIAKAVGKEIDRINAAARRGGLRGLLRREREEPVVETPDRLEIFIQPDRDGEVEPGTLGIISKLLVPARPDFVGPATVRTVKTIVAEGQRTATVVDPAATATRATLAYRDEVGEQVVPILKDLVKVGRGGSGAWADVQVFSTQKVSREHCWIVRDEQGRFFIRDVSVWGTSVNGQPLPPAVRSAEGTVSEPGAQAELPPNARIQLADALVMDFRVVVERAQP